MKSNSVPPSKSAKHDYDAICDESAAYMNDLEYPMNDTFKSWREVLLAMRPGDDRTEFECPSLTCGFSAKSERAVVDHCLGESKSRSHCPEETLYAQLYWKHEDDIQERVSAILAANPDKVKEANDVEVNLLSEIEALKDAFPDQYAKFKGYAKNAAAYLVAQPEEAEKEIGRSREISKYLEGVCRFYIEVKTRQFGM